MMFSLRTAVMVGALTSQTVLDMGHAEVWRLNVSTKWDVRSYTNILCNSFLKKST